MDLDELTLGQMKKLKNLFDCSTDTPKGMSNCGTQIVVLDRGFVYVGQVSIDDKWCYIRNAKNIRKWGTTKGLGQLVNGPLKDTVLDATGDVQAPRKALIHFCFPARRSALVRNLGE